MAEVDYTYYTSAGTHGSVGDLQLVTKTTQLSDTAHTSKQYFRYWRDGDSEGNDHQVKLVLSTEGTRRYDWDDDGIFNDGFLSATDANLKPYASHYFEYDSEGRVILATFGGDCGCSGGTVGEYEFAYEENTARTDDPVAYDSEWERRTVVQRPDGTYLTQYFDEAGQAIHRVVTDADPAVGSPATWVTMVARDDDGLVEKIHTPANVTGYTHDISTWAITTSTSAGLVRAYTRKSSGAMTGFVEDVLFQEGTNEAPAMTHSTDYTSQTLSGIDANSTRPLVSNAHVYPDGTTNTDWVTQYAYTYYSGSLMP